MGSSCFPALAAGTHLSDGQPDSMGSGLPDLLRKPEVSLDLPVQSEEATLLSHTACSQSWSGASPGLSPRTWAEFLVAALGGAPCWIWFCALFPSALSLAVLAGGAEWLGRGPECLAPLTGPSSPPGVGRCLPEQP